MLTVTCSLVLVLEAVPVTAAVITVPNIKHSHKACLSTVNPSKSMFAISEMM